MRDAGAESHLYEKPSYIGQGPPPERQKPPIILNFQSAHDALHYAVTAERLWEPTSQPSITSFVSSDLEVVAKIGSRTWPEAVDLARNGWPQGRKLLVNARSQHITTDRMRVRSVGYDIAGALPDVPRYVAGDPEHMMDVMPSMRKTKSVIRVAVSPMCAIHVSWEARANWGAALLSWIAAEELAGNTVEIDIVYVTKSPIFEVNEFIWGPPIVVRFTLQSTNRYMSIDQLAFWLMHPAAHQRIQFAIREKLDVGWWYTKGNVYGNAVTDRKDVMQFADAGSLLLILGEGAPSVADGLRMIEEDVGEWKKRQALERAAARVY